MDEMRSNIDWIISGKEPFKQTQPPLQHTVQQAPQQQMQPQAQTQPALLPQTQQAQPSAQHTISQAPSAAPPQQKPAPAQPILIQTTASQQPPQNTPQNSQNGAAFQQISQPEADLLSVAPKIHEVLPKPRSNGVNINLISQQMLDGMAGEEKITFVLGEVKLGKILVLEYGLTPEEQAKLIERTMMEIDPETFIGIEMQSYAAETKMGFFQKLVGKMARPRMTVIGPADLLCIVHKDNRVIQTILLTGKSTE